VPDAGALSCGQQVGHAGAEEFQGGLVECRRVRQVDHDVGALQRLVQAISGDHVDAGRRCRGLGLVSGCGQLLHHLRADPSGTADDCELHGF